MDNLPIKQEKNVFWKLKNFFKKLFCKSEINFAINSESNNIEIEKSPDFSESLKEDVSYDFVSEIKKKEFLKEIENNPDLLKELSLERLEQLDSYYDEVIAEYKEKIDKLKRVG